MPAIRSQQTDKCINGQTNECGLHITRYFYFAKNASRGKQERDIGISLHDFLWWLMYAHELWRCSDLQIKRQTSVLCSIHMVYVIRGFLWHDLPWFWVHKASALITSQETTRLIHATGADHSYWLQAAPPPSRSCNSVSPTRVPCDRIYGPFTLEIAKA
jgi:hypothetical protein